MSYERRNGAQEVYTVGGERAVYVLALSVTKPWQLTKLAPAGGFSRSGMYCIIARVVQRY